MTTPAEMVASVLDRFSRYDLEDKVMGRFPRALQSAHSTNDFRRDLKTINVYDPLVSSGISTISVSADLPRLRKIKGIATYAGYETVGLVNVPNNPHLTAFKDLTLGEFNYYGFANRQTWILAGNVLNLNGVESNTRAIGIMGLFFPSYALNGLTDEWETDSWLMIESPDIVEAYLNLYVAQVIQNDKQIRTYQEALALARNELLRTYEQEMV